MRKRTYSHIKGLAENRAEFSAEVLRLEGLQREIDSELTHVRGLLAAVDRLLSEIKPEWDPTEIAPVHRHERYGKRGEFTDYVAQLLSDAHPSALKTFEVAASVRLKYHLDFETPARAARWVHNSLERILKNLVLAGRIEHIKKHSETGPAVSHWRSLEQALLDSERNAI